MIAFTILVIWTVLSYALCKKIKPGDAKKLYCWNMFFATLFFQGLRSIYIGGVDTSLVYARNFERAINIPFSNIPTRFGKDYLFYYLTKLFTYICTDFHAYVFVISCFVLGSFSLFVYKHSEIPVLSYIIYYALGYYAVGFQMLRHVMAVSVLLFAYNYILERKFIKFTVIVLLAACFHSSALIFLIAYPIALIKINYKQWLAIAFMITAVFVAKDKIVGTINYIISGSDRYSSYSTSTSQLSLIGAMILLGIYIASFIYSYPLFKETNELRMFLNMSVVSVAFMTLVTIVGEFHRISMFFGMYNTLLLPKAWNLYRDEHNLKTIYLFVMGAIFIAYFLLFGLGNYNLQTYRFFWMD